MAKYCTSCGAQNEDNANVCGSCGNQLNAQTQVQNNNVATGGEPKSKIAAALLGIFLGGWGIHNFYLGYNNKAVIQIVVTIVTCGFGALWGFIEGILILTGNINCDANGVPLKD